MVLVTMRMLQYHACRNSQAMSAAIVRPCTGSQRGLVAAHMVSTRPQGFAFQKVQLQLQQHMLTMPVLNIVELDIIDEA